ncbi:uncharacterized membrane protein YhaH (DUF805 family) [Roseiarcus fermentans]|uniref:Uncharacterized membrane protein YhaH (DUF805 family) n=1 Tax=Roseiarcus fermentans TaxID=1473586 RepID=A0A366F219_9HYPH|nr:DUF805 domain-containing protein [Roseiarcus fermentans]RBP08196.1 uncharacterized membrane protein YhaH (DUF805 family) [Roseiarcus fermentans]
MTFQAAVQTAFVKKYADFQGRANRPEFWWFMLAVLIATLIAAIIDDELIGGGEIVETIVGLATIVPSLAVGVRRLHDTDRSGWWQLLHLLPLIGLIVLIVWWVTPGNAAPNRFGAPETVG